MNQSDSILILILFYSEHVYFLYIFLFLFCASRFGSVSKGTVEEREERECVCVEPLVVLWLTGFHAPPVFDHLSLQSTDIGAVSDTSRI